METKQEIVRFLKEDLNFTIKTSQNKDLTIWERAYNEGHKDATIRLLYLLDAYDENLIDEIKENYFYKKHEEDDLGTSKQSPDRLDTGGRLNSEM